MQKIDKMKKFFKRRRIIQPLPNQRRTALEQQIAAPNDNDTSNCPNTNCSSYNFGVPLKICVRFCSIIGMISSLFYIIAGTSLITHISQTEQIGFSTFSAQQSPQTATTRHIYYRRNVGFFIGIAVILVILNSIQLLSDFLLCLSTLKAKTCSLWVFMAVDVTLWIMILICFITIFSGGGLFLLLVFLLGTAIRAYITFILHEYMIEESKMHGNVIMDSENNKVEEEPTTSSHPQQPHHLMPSPIPEESIVVEPYSICGSSNYEENCVQVDSTRVGEAEKDACNSCDMNRSDRNKSLDDK